MVGFKKFIAVLLSMVVAVSVFTIVGTSLLQGGNKGATRTNHFSVRWMGFAPTDYASDYPEYSICINNLKDDPLMMQIALQIKNQEDSAYYFKVDQGSGPPAGWSILPMAVGEIGVDETLPFIYDNAYRTKPASIPAGRLTETINLVVQAYHDPGYTSLYSQDNFDVTFNFLDYTSPSWTVVSYDNFDDGTTQGWTQFLEGAGHFGSVAASDTYYRSFQYSLRLHIWTSTSSAAWVRGAYQKSFNIGLASEAYMIFSMRSEIWEAHDANGVQIDGVTYFKSDTTPAANVWYQFAVKLKTAQLNTVAIWASRVSGISQETYQTYLDDVYVIIQ